MPHNSTVETLRRGLYEAEQTRKYSIALRAMAGIARRTLSGKPTVLTVESAVGRRAIELNDPDLLDSFNRWLSTVSDEFEAKAVATEEQILNEVRA